MIIAGGENVARGSLLGALLGAAHGINGFPAWSLELYHKDEIFAEIDNFLGLPSSSKPQPTSVTVNLDSDVTAAAAADNKVGNGKGDKNCSLH